MKYNKFLYFILILVFGIVIKLFFIPVKKIKVEVEYDKIIFSSTTIKIPLKIFATKDVVSHISFYVVEKNVQQKVYTDFVIALKKGQDYSLNCEIDNNVVDKKDNFLFLTKISELLPKTRKYTVYASIKKPIQKVEKVVIEPVYTTTSVASTAEISKPVLKEEKIQEERKEEKIVVKEKPNFEIIISSQEIKEKYNYDEKIKLLLYVKNKTVSLTINPKINIVLKTKFNIIVSTQALTVKLLPQEEKTVYIEFDVLKDYLPSIYYFEFNSVFENVSSTGKSKEFEIVDNPPKISLPEPPVIRYKLSNTILAEVEDDKEISEVKFIEVIPKKKPQNEYQIITENQMILVAGNKKAGLYSFTTPKIVKKDFYMFYIQAKDSAENITKTEVFKIKITK